MADAKVKLTSPEIRFQNFLLDHQIAELAQSHGLIEPFDEGLLSGCTYDLRAGSILRSRNRLSSFNLSGDGYIVESGECVTIQTMERVNLASQLLFAFIVNKHSILAQGFFHPTTTIDPGFQGPLALTFLHMGSERVRIKMGTPIAKVAFVPIDAQPQRIYGLTQSPSYREGSTDFALIVDRPVGIDDSALSTMYGMPVKRLYDRLGVLEDSLGTFELRRQEERRKRRRVVLWGIFFAILSGASGSFLAIYWKDIKGFLAYITKLIF